MNVTTHFFLGEAYVIISVDDILKELLGYKCPRLGSAWAKTPDGLPV